MSGFDYEKLAWDMGFRLIAGVDEVGRGPLAGPVVCCAVIMPLDEPIEIPEQELTPMERTGFTVVEWGGTDASYMKR